MVSLVKLIVLGVTVVSHRFNEGFEKTHSVPPSKVRFTSVVPTPKNRLNSVSRGLPAKSTMVVLRDTR